MGADCATAVVSATSLASALALDSAGSDSGIELPDPIKTIEKFTDCAKAFMTKDPTTRLKKVVVCALKVVLLIGGTEGAIFHAIALAAWDIFMPEGKSASPWEQVKNQTEQMINEKLDAALFKDMESTILGIGDNVKMWSNKIDMKVGKNDISQVSAGCKPRVSAGKA
jgi:hypothetical protein